MGRKKVELNIFRYSPESGGAAYYDKVSVDIDADMPITVLDLLMRVQHEQLQIRPLVIAVVAGSVAPVL